ncbi:chaplin [Kitasatospora herbaricolor]|uniref:Chaplin n=1 Tax=Kitasatospora herbaricolor TaxID=68217 RepID=A0ABZ1WBK6_9ACTN|nr:chaplin [Kitasatospora herbaricolor]
MQNVKKAVVLTAAAAGMVLAGAGAAAASSTAEGVAAGSPGVLSGNLIQVPVHVPVNLCGNSVNVIGALNPAFGNSCANVEVPQQQQTPPVVEEDC